MAGLMCARRTCLRRWLDNNGLTGPIPDSLGSLSNLQQLCVPPMRQLCAHTRAHDGAMTVTHLHATSARCSCAPCADVVLFFFSPSIVVDARVLA
jgi:hypothetical protein